MGLIDLHTHSICSDGVYSVEKLIDKAVSLGLSGISLTDHDTFEGIAIASAYLKKSGMNFYFLAGCEFSSYTTDVGEIHILGYFSNRVFDGLVDRMAEFREDRQNRAHKIVECLKKQGINLDTTVLLKDNKSPVGRMHIARELVRQGFYPDTNMAFEKMLRAGCPCYVRKKEISTPDIIKTIKDFSGKAVLAHPTFLYQNKNWDYLNTYMAAGLDGIEFKHPKVSQSLSADIVKNFKSKLILTAGSDFHGDSEHEEIGNFGIDQDEALHSFGAFTDTM